MAHGLEDCIVELNGARDEQGGVRLLGGHVGLLTVGGNGSVEGRLDVQVSPDET